MMVVDVSDKGLGDILKSLRVQHGWTLKDVAERTGLSAPSLSKVERGLMSLTLERLLQIAQGLELDIADLFNPGRRVLAKSPATRLSVTRAGEGDVVETHAMVYRYLNTDVLHKKFQAIVIEMKSASAEEFGSWVTHPGEEFLLCLYGDLSFNSEYFSPTRLKPGDSLYFDSEMRHCAFNVGPKRCVFLSVATNPAVRGAPVTDEPSVQAVAAFRRDTAKRPKDSGVLGRALKRIRDTRGWTLMDLAERTGISASTLSKIERNRLSLTYDRIVQLAKGVEMDIAALLTEPERSEATTLTTRLSLNRGEAGEVTDTPVMRYRPLSTDLLRRQFAPVLIDLKARSLKEFGPLVRHSGEEFIYILEGSMEFHSEHYAPVVLEAGDAIYFDAGMGHAEISISDRPCRMLAVCTSPKIYVAGSLADAMGGVSDAFTPAQAIHLRA